MGIFNHVRFLISNPEFGKAIARTTIFFSIFVSSLMGMFWSIPLGPTTVCWPPEPFEVAELEAGRMY